MLQWLSHNKAIGIVFTGILLISIGIKFFLDPLSNSDYDLAYSFMRTISIDRPLISVLSLLLYLIVVFLLFIRISRANKLIENSLFITSFFYFIAVLLFPNFAFNLWLSIGSLFLLLAIYLMLQIHHQSSVMKELFIASLLIGLSALFYFPLILFSLLIILTMSIFRPFELRNIFVIVLGMLMPLFYYLSLSYLFDYAIDTHVFQLPAIDVMVFEKNQLPFLLFLIIPFVGLIKLYMTRSKFVVRQRNQLVILVVFLLLYSSMFLWLPLALLLPVILVNLAFYSSYYYQNMNKKWVLDGILAILLIVSLIQ